MELKDIKYELYNGVIETAGRALIILDAFRDNSIKFSSLRLFDFFVVFGEDVGFDKSIQIRIGGRGNAYNFRHQILLPAIELMIEAELIMKTGEDSFRITPKGEESVKKLYSVYANELKMVCVFMLETANTMTLEKYIPYLQNLINGLALEPFSRPVDTEKYDGLMTHYERDQVRMNGLSEFVLFLQRHVLHNDDFSDQRLKADWLEKLSEEVEKELVTLEYKIQDLKSFQKSCL